jgi:hypothetical protein
MDAVSTVLRIGNLPVVIYPNDHRPAHVHVIGADGEAVFVLSCAAASGCAKTMGSRGAN